MPKKDRKSDRKSAGANPTSHTLTDDQRRKILSEQEAIIRQHKGDEFKTSLALCVIDRSKAYRTCQPPFKRIQDYASAVHGMSYRTWRKNISWVRVNEIILEHLRQKCPVGHVPSAPVLNKAKARELESLSPDLIAKAFEEADKLPKDKKGEIPTSSINQIATKYKQQMYDAKVAKLTAKEIDDRFSSWFVCGDMLNVPEIKADHFDMVITSPPYGLREIKYDVYKDNMPAAKYLRLLEEWAERIRFSLKTTGRACINLPNTHGRDRQHNMFIQPLPCRLFNIMERFGDMHLYQWNTWDRMFLTTAHEYNWGSYHSCSQPNARRRTENILVFAKGSTKRKATERLRDITETAFKAWSVDLWGIGPERQVTWHPCPFPLDIAVRLMLFYGQRKDKILDPFGGSGTTALAAAMLDRECTSVELSPTYTDLGRRRLIEYLDSGKGKKRLDFILRQAEREADEGVKLHGKTD